MMTAAFILLVVCAYVFGYACGFTTGVSETENLWSDASKRAGHV